MLKKNVDKLSQIEIKKLKDAETVIEQLKNYQYPYSKKKNNPILIVGPAGDDTDLRVYAYGGCIGKIATEDAKHCKLAFQKDAQGEKDYSYGKYLIDGYQNGHETVFDFESVPELKNMQKQMCLEQGTDISQDEQKYCLYNAFDQLAGVCKEKDDKKKMLMNTMYLHLIISAAYTRFMHRKKGKIVGLSERSKQTLIAKQSQGHEWNEKDKKMIVIDIESDIPLHYKDGSEKKKAKVDFVVFDGEAFGLIEFKYQGDSMEENSENSLKNHYRDFEQIVDKDDNQNKINLIIELIRRMDYLITYGIIDSSWKAPLKKLEDRILGMTAENYDSSLLWYGFYFVGGDENYIHGEIKKQLPTGVRCKYIKDADNIHITM